MSNPARPTTPLDEQILAAVVQVLGAEERNVGLSQPAGIGQRPKPLTVEAGGWRREEPHSEFAAALNRARGPAWRSGPASPEGPGAPGPAGPEARYFLSRVDDLHALETAQATGVYPFAQATAKKLLKVKQEGSRVVVVFSCARAGALLGCARLQDSPPASLALEWLSTQHVPHHAIRHITNSLAGGARAAGARDGTELCCAAARALLAAAPRRHPRHTHHPHQPRPIQKHEP
ncbi:3'-5' RNA helicase YTHDC2-like [Ostrinia nubilalis]|uniref:3'-5' RNA helicase YTHDC2-like n=1 Tax=Ostrinia nubilalis TaxID=29057 RepID=UPI0030826866